MNSLVGEPSFLTLSILITMASIPTLIYCNIYGEDGSALGLLGYLVMKLKKKVFHKGERRCE